MDLKLSSIRVFLVAAEHNSFREAAKKLGLTVATVSNHVASLESFLGVKLFERGARGASLTPEGRVVYRDLKRLLEGLLEIKSKVEELGLRSNLLTVASMELSIEHVVPCVISKFKENVNPNMSFMLKRGDEAYCIGEVRVGKADIAFIEGIEKRAEWSDVEYMELATDRFVVVSPAKWGLKGRVKMEDLRGYPVVMCDPKSGMGSLVYRYLELNEVKPATLNVKAVFPSVTSTLTAVSQGLGLTITPLTSIRGLVGDYHDLRVASIKSRVEKVSFHAVKRRDASSKVEEFWGFLEKLKEEAKGSLPCVRVASERIWRMIR